MSIDGETLSAITGMEEACATARARVEDLVAELDDLRRCLCSVIAQRDEAQAKIAGLPAWQKGCEQALADLADAEEAIARLYTERDEALAEVKTWKHDWYVAKADLGTAMRLADVALRDVAEKYERALRERDEARASVADAYRRGAEAMREACAQRVTCLADACPCQGKKHAANIRALPIPEDAR